MSQTCWACFNSSVLYRPTERREEIDGSGMSELLNRQFVQLNLGNCPDRRAEYRPENEDQYSRYLLSVTASTKLIQSKWQSHI